MILEIGVVNQSTLLKPIEAKAMVAAVQFQLMAHVSRFWNLDPMPVTLYAAGQVPSSAATLPLVDDPSLPDDLGFHDEQTSGVIDGEISVRPCLESGSTALSGAYPVSGTLSHEGIETYLNACTNLWAVSKDGLCVCHEGCDPVEAWSYPIHIELEGQTFTVYVSDFVLPSYFDPYGKGPFNYLGMGDASKRLPGPFTKADDGYYIAGASPASAQSVFGEKMPAWRRELKSRAPSRAMRIARRHAAKVRP